MDIRNTSALKALFGGLFAALVLSGCNEVYQQPDYTYSPGYSGVSDRRMIRNCELKVENKIARKTGDSYPVEFGYVDVTDVADYQSRVKGSAYLRDRNGQQRVDYRCTVRNDNGRVTDVNLDWRGRPGKGNSKINAASVCKPHISRKVQRETRQQVSIDYRKYDGRDMSGKRRKISGKAVIGSTSGNGKIHYECVVNTQNMRLESASYQWTKKLPAPPPHTHSPQNGTQKDKAIKHCHNALSKKIRNAGYKNATFKSSNQRSAGKSEVLVSGKLSLKYQGQHQTAKYECRVNSNNGKVKSSHYSLKHK